MGSNPDPQPLPFWQVNIQSDEREEECPEPLQNLSAKDMGIIGTRDEDYCVQSWEQVVDIVRSGRLQDFGRWPSELRMYREFVWKVKQDRGSVMEYMLTERLHWEQPIVSRSRRPFEHEDDFRILFNDWPYGIDNRIVHLVVWTKFDLEDDAETETKIERFIQRTFSSEVPEDKLVWFKNPPSLKSVHAVEHIHVMLFDPDPACIRRLTNGDEPRGQLLHSANTHRR